MMDMVRYFDKDVPRINHALKVHAFANNIARLERLDTMDQLVVEVAALLHDIGIPEAERKYQSTAGPYQEAEGPPIAQAMLENLGFEEALIQRVCYLIAHHHSYQYIDGKDFQILVEADFLVNIFEERMSTQAVKSIREKYFRTPSALEILDAMY